MSLPSEFKRFTHARRTSIKDETLSYHDMIALVIDKCCNGDGVSWHRLETEIETLMSYRTLFRFFRGKYCGKDDLTLRNGKTKTYWYLTDKKQYRLTLSGYGRVQELYSLLEDFEHHEKAQRVASVERIPVLEEAPPPSVVKKRLKFEQSSEERCELRVFHNNDSMIPVLTVIYTSNKDVLTIKSGIECHIELEPTDALELSDFIHTWANEQMMKLCGTGGPGGHK